MGVKEVEEKVAAVILEKDEELKKNSKMISELIAANIDSKEKLREKKKEVEHKKLESDSMKEEFKRKLNEDRSIKDEASKKIQQFREREMNILAKIDLKDNEIRSIQTENIKLKDELNTAKADMMELNGLYLSKIETQEKEHNFVVEIFDKNMKELKLQEGRILKERENMKNKHINEMNRRNEELRSIEAQNINTLNELKQIEAEKKQMMSTNETLVTDKQTLEDEAEKNQHAVKQSIKMIKEVNNQIAEKDCEIESLKKSFVEVNKELSEAKGLVFTQYENYIVSKHTTELQEKTT